MAAASAKRQPGGGSKSGRGQNPSTAQSRTASDPTTPDRQALVVLGMHRSGTSALAGMLGLSGASLPAHLMPATDANARGFFESEPLWELHEELLAELNTSWHDVSALPTGFMGSSVVGHWVERLAKTLDEEFGDASLFVLKDPRICRLLPLWMAVFQRVHVQPLYLLAVRNPLDVAASLARLHQIPESKSLWLWLDHVLRAERHSRGEPRVVVSYESLLQDWRRVRSRVEQQLDVALPPVSRESEAEIDEFLSGSLRKHQSRVGQLEDRKDLGDWVSRVYAWAVRADQDGDAPSPDLDPIHDGLIEAGRALGPALASAELASQELRSDVIELREAFDGARRERNLLLDWVKVLVPWAAELSSGRAVSPGTQGEILKALDAVTPADRASVATAGLRFAEQAARIAELEELVERAEGRAEEIRALDLRAARLRAEFALAVERAERRERELVELEAKRQNEIVELQRQQSALAETHAGELAERAESHAAELAALAASAAQISDERAQAQAWLAKARADVADLELFVAQLRSRLVAMESSRTWRWSGPVRTLKGFLGG